MSVKASGKLLVVEDDVSWLRNYEKTLTKSGYVVFSASDYQAALNLIERHYFHAAILDVRLVDRDEKNIQGMEILNRITSNREETGLFIITAYPDFEKSKEAYSRHRILEFIDKQAYDASKLLVKLEEGIDLSNQFLKKIKDGLSKFSRGEVMEKVGEKANPEIANILESLLLPLTPIKNVQQYTVKSGEPVFLFKSTYWSRFEGEPYTIKIGQRKQILEYANGIKQQRKKVFVDTKQSLSGVRYVSESVDFDQIISRPETEKE